MNEVFLLLGSNLGDRLAYINGATDLIEKNIGDVFRKSSIYETAAFGKEDQPAFMNQVISVLVDDLPINLLKKLMEIEEQLGRKRTEKWAERTIDIDILFYGDRLVNLPELIIPHSEIEFRRFTLVPLNELIPNFLHPKTKRSIVKMLVLLPDDLSVKIIL